MYEFDSVSVSSFEAASLAATLTEKSADGWDVVAVVPTGSDVVAYLRRSTSDASTTAEEAVVEATPEPAVAEAATAERETPAIDLLTPTSAGTGAASTGGTAAEAGATGWGASGESGTTTTETSLGGGTSGGGWSGGGTDSSSWGGSGQQQQQTAAAASTPSVPAGWYADPAGRFELRYWDGNAWTEHVSRAGQQYTDPPVA